MRYFKHSKMRGSKGAYKVLASSSETFRSVARTEAILALKRYAISTSGPERITLAFLAGMESYFREHERNPWPGSTPYSLTYLTSYIEPFYERERLQAQYDLVHEFSYSSTVRQEAIISATLKDIINICVKRIEPLEKL